jgi:23S rRNA (guanosine2251-2'-O)-methyltransferase
MTQKLHQIRKCLKPSCGFRFPNHLFSEQYVFCPKCGAPTEIVENPYSGMVGDKDERDHNLHIEVLLDNIRSAHNVGSIIRTSDGVGISHIHCCGITPTPDNQKVKKTALSAEQHIPWTQYWNSIEAGNKLIESGYFLVALEGAEEAVSIFDFLAPPLPQKQPVVLVIGNEVSGVDPGLLSICHKKIWLPMLGKKQSFNVSVAFGIAAYLIRFSELM